MFSLLLSVVVIIFLAWLAIWVLGKLAPGHPAIVDNIIWVIAVLYAVLVLARAVGVTDIPVPRLH